MAADTFRGKFVSAVHLASSPSPSAHTFEAVKGNDIDF